MQTKLNPYLNFRDEARQAIEFYQSVFGGKLSLQTFKDFHASQDPADDNKVMHAQLETGNGMTLMACDTPNSMDYQPGANISLAISGDNDPELRGYFEKLSSGGAVIMPMEKAAWGDIFGMCADKFGVKWLVSIAATA